MNKILDENIFFICYKSKKIEYQGKIITKKKKKQEEIISVDDD